MITHISIDGRTRTIAFLDEADLQRQIRMIKNPNSIEAIRNQIDVLETNIRNMFNANKNNSRYIKLIEQL